ncbi:hypothetical protein SAMN04487919_12656 [Bacillus sp. ok061]|uniref:hypothetical protein n=1 Tax=Bacillus sp. ok061 TaxID=1761766 RepID=UPI00089E7931|nr:hypothetical protein [Bacillus sp. ok061]SEG78651.1 hypothetical protein SAMN04487919_12656 [Bacillus sp. ok061]
MKNKIIPILLSSTFALGLFSFSPSSYAAANESGKSVEKVNLKNTGIPEVNPNSEFQPFVTNQVPISTFQEAPPGPDYYHPNPGSMNYQLIDSFTGNSKTADTISEFTKQFLIAITPGGILKNYWAGAAASALFNTFHDKPSTRYYKTFIYQAQDAYCYYGKAVVYVYSDSARTKLVTTKEHYSTVWK